jgi:hypothetical protein
MENIEKGTTNLENNEIIGPIKQIESIEINTHDVLNDVGQEISKRQKSIDDTVVGISEIRDKLGLGLLAEIPPALKQSQETLDKLKNQIEYFNEIPIEKDKYYRVTGISEILSIIKNKSLNKSGESFFDRQILNQISNISEYSIDELELINAENPQKIREIYNKYILKPNNEKKIVTLVAKTKSNHGDIGFVKEGFFYNPNDKKRGHFGAPVIVGSQEKSKFQKGVHGNRHNIYNEEIGPKTAVVLKDGLDASNFEYWLYEKNKGWHKNSFEDLQVQFSK